jgi:hypothetical protein
VLRPISSASSRRAASSGVSPRRTPPPGKCQPHVAFGTDGATGYISLSYRLAELPKPKLDNREVIEARLTSPIELQNMALTDLVASYLARRQSTGRPQVGQRNPFKTKALSYLSYLPYLL